MTEVEIRWEFAKQWILRDKPEIQESILARILKRFAKREFNNSNTAFLEIDRLCSVIEQSYQDFIDFREVDR